jgi:hypothetical protein
MSSPDNVHDRYAVRGLESRVMDGRRPFGFARGKPALRDGDPWLGKSVLALVLCARLSTGQRFPTPAESRGPGCAVGLNSGGRGRAGARGGGESGPARGCVEVA